MIAMPENLPRPRLKPNADVAPRKRPDGKPTETPRDPCRRVASAIAAEEGKYGGASRQPESLPRDFHDLMTSWNFCGTPRGGA